MNKDNNGDNQKLHLLRYPVQNQLILQLALIWDITQDSISDNIMSSQNITSPLVDSQKYKSLALLIKLSLNCGLGAFCFGYCLTSFNSISFKHIVAIFNLQDYPYALTQGILTGSTCFTAAIGTFIGKKLIQKYSRRQCLMILSYCAIFVSLLSLIAAAFTLFIARLGQGLVIGAISCLTPLYMRQMMPKQVSGPLWSLCQICFVVGSAFGFILTFFLGFFWEPMQTWRIIFGFPIITSTIQIINFTYFYRFDTPKWYITKGDKAGAEQAISFIYKPQYTNQILKDTIDAHMYSLEKPSEATDAEVEMDIIEAEGAIKGKQRIEQIKTTSSKITNNSLAVFTGFFVICQQHFLGGVAVVQYSGEMTLKTFPSLQKIFPAIISLLSIVGAVVSIQMMRKWGRRQILIGGAFVSTVSLFICYMIFRRFNFQNAEENSVIFRIILLITFVIIRCTLSSAMGPVPMLYVAEILQPSLVAWCFLLNWLLLGIQSVIFPVICEANGGNPSLAFLIFFVGALTAFVVNQKVVIETKGKTELQIRKQFDQLCQ